MALGIGRGIRVSRADLARRPMPAEEGAQPCPGGIGAGDGNGRERAAVQEQAGGVGEPSVAGGALDGDQHGVLTEEAAGRGQPHERGEPDRHRPERDRHDGTQPTHVAEQIGPDPVDDHTRAQEEQRLERAVREQMEDRGLLGAGGERPGHVGELADRGIGQHPLQVLLRQGGEGGAEHAERGGDREQVQRRPGGEKCRVEPRDDEDAGRDHRGGVDERADGGGTGHRVGQPGVQRHLGALAGHPGEQQHRRGDHGRGGHVRNFLDHLVNAETARREAQREDPEQEADIAQPGDEERLHRRPGVRPILPPVPDQQVGAQAHDLPADVQDDQVARVDDQEHRAGEEGDECRVRRITRLVPHISDRIHLYGQCHDRHQDGHQRREAVHTELQRDGDGTSVDHGERAPGRARQVLGPEPSAARRAGGRAALSRSGTEPQGAGDPDRQRRRHGGGGDHEPRRATVRDPVGRAAHPPRCQQRGGGSEERQ
jgi:hypothetical protein